MLSVGDLVQLDIAPVYGLVLELKILEPEPDRKADAYVYWFDSGQSYWCLEESLIVLSKFSLD